MILQKVFPEKEAKKIQNLLKRNKTWKKIYQVKKKHYSHVFKFNNDLLPSKKEIYSSFFYRSYVLEKSDYINQIIKKIVIKKVEKKIKKKIKAYDIRVMSMRPGCYIRLHQDNYISDYAITISLNSLWVWDWGGILSIVNNNSTSTSSIIPSWNTASIMKTKINKTLSPHFVSQVTNYAKNTRYSITLFCKTN